MAAFSTIVDVNVATIQGQLPAPVVFGDWIMKQREFAVVRMRTASGHEGWAFTLTRDGAVAEQIRRTIARVYVGTDVADRARPSGPRGGAASRLTAAASACARCRSWTSRPGMSRPSSPIVRSPNSLEATAKPMPATAIIGYPPATR